MSETTEECSIDGCGKRRKTRGWCTAHYERWRRHGDPHQTAYAATLWDRFWPKVDGTGDCWEWTATKNYSGYGQIGLTGTRKLGMAHRVAWELLIGEIPAGLELDHLCRNPGCVNPTHLEPVTHAENMARAPWTAVQQKRAQTHCAAGHELVAANLYPRLNGHRECLTCKRSRRDRVDRRVAGVGSDLPRD